MAGFLGHPGVEHDLELQIAELVDQRVHVAAMDCVGDLIGFFDRVGRDRFERLHAVPFAAGVAVAQPLHDIVEAIQAHLALPRREGAFEARPPLSNL